MKKIHYKTKSFDSKNADIWIVVDLECKLYNNPNKRVVISKYSKGKIIKDFSNKYAVVEFDNGKVVMLNKKYILINLYDVMQKEVIYSITNATSAIYNINGNDIPEVTGRVLYPNMIESGKFKVPLMYRTAEKLFHAENDFLKQGLTIKIYDTYRPYPVTQYLYEKTLKIADKYSDVLNRTINGFEYSQKWFLAEHESSHNYGVAIDMSLVDLNNNEELAMQSNMHDLSVFSVIDYNNDNAKKMYKIMKKNRFSPLRSEWWHFQDNSAKVAAMDFYVS